MSYRVRLYRENGAEVGEFRTPTLTWAQGDELEAGDGNRYAIVGKVPFDDDLAFVGGFLVTPLELAEPV